MRVSRFTPASDTRLRGNGALIIPGFRLNMIQWCRSTGDDAFAEQEAAVRPGVADLHDREARLRGGVKGEALKGAHRDPTGRALDLRLYLRLSGRDRRLVADHLHAADGFRLEIVERQKAQDRP